MQQQVGFVLVATCCRGSLELKLRDVTCGRNHHQTFRPALLLLALFWTHHRWQYELGIVTIGLQVSQISSKLD